MTKEEKLLPYIAPIAFMIIILALVPWAKNFLSYAINVDIAYLTLSAGRLLAGEAMSEAYYDTNLPLSIIVQIPAALIAKITPIPLYYATTIYVFILLGLSTLATNLLLKKINEITISQRYIVLSVFIIMNTIKLGYDFGQKDHIIAMALFPLILAQVLITARIDFNNFLKCSVLFAGSLLILLKPHYGLVPAAIFLHRIFYQRRLSVFKDIDFLFLAGMALIYVASIFLFFPDFISIILPDILKYYASDISPEVIKVGLILMVQAAIPLLICQLFLKKAPALVSIFSAVAIICLIPFIMQGKGWAYHAIPENIFFYSSVGLFIGYIISFTLENLKIKEFEQTAGLLIVTGLLLFIVSKNYKKNIDIPTHDSYKNTGFAKMINECKSENCSFLVLHDMINISHEFSVYTGREHASRFPIMWFVPFLLNAQNKIDKHEMPLLTQKEIDGATDKYTNMIADDFEKYKPDIIFVGLFPNPIKDGELFDFRAYLLEKNPQRFEKIWNSYTLEKSDDVDRLEYMERLKPGEKLIRYNIYKKKIVTEGNENE